MPANGGPIPARAGEPLRQRCRCRRYRAYPRACGGTKGRDGFIGLQDGLSPRVRGNLRAICSTRNRWGPIPARAGEPHRQRSGFRECRAYPRACGGTNEPNVALPPAAGLSPRVRGNRLEHRAFVDRGGPIPARAGEPCSACNRVCSIRAYPRACGGTHRQSPQYMSDLGLSPRVRGNHSAAYFSAAVRGPIPARAGEPADRA